MLAVPWLFRILQQTVLENTVEILRVHAVSSASHHFCPCFCGPR